MSRFTEKTKPEFLPSFGNKPMEYVGREQIIHNIDKSLNSYPGSKDRAILITGQRGTGKTALLLEIADEANEQDFVVAHVSAGKSMLDDIIERLHVMGSRYFTKDKRKLSGLEAGAMGFSLGLFFSEETKNDYGFRTKLEIICDELNEKNIGVLILVDEVQPDSEEMRSLISTYQHLAGAEKDIALIMAGLPHIISSILNEKSLTFFNRATKISLGAVPIQRIHVYYENAFARAKRTASTEVLREAAKSTQGFPYLLQLIGYYLMEYSKESKSINESTLKKTMISSEIELKENIFKPALKPLSARDLDFLKAMAKDNSETLVADIAKRMKVSNGTVQTYRQRLIEHAIICSPRRGYIEFCIPYLKDYLRGDI